MKHNSSKTIQDAVLVATHQPIGSKITEAHTSSKVDVYDYAAQFDTLPQFEMIRVASNSELNAKQGYFVLVTVKGTNVIGEGYSPSSHTHAEMAACLNFKKRAEELHQGEKMMVKHINTLTSQTGKKFLQYCKIKHKDWEQYNFTSKSYSAGFVVGQLFLGERLLSECSMFT